MTFSDEPVQIDYKRWRNREGGYEAIVVAVTHSRGEHGVYTVVELRRKDDGRLQKWPAPAFLQRFEPLGRRLRIKSSWERL